MASVPRASGEAISDGEEGGAKIKRRFTQDNNISTRNVLTFVNTTAIAYTQNSAFLPGSWHHAIVVLFTNVRTLRVQH